MIIIPNEYGHPSLKRMVLRSTYPGMHCLPHRETQFPASPAIIKTENYSLFRTDNLSFSRISSTFSFCSQVRDLAVDS